MNPALQNRRFFWPLAFTFLLSSATYAADTAILGTWLANERSRGGLGEIFEFRSKGDVMWTYGALLNGTFEVQPSKLTLALSDSKEKPIEFNYSFKGSNLRLQDLKSNKTLDMSRLKGIDTRSPIGVWTYKDETGADAFWEFNADKHWLFSLPMQQASAHYLVYGADLSIQWSGQSEQEYVYSIHEDRMTLKSKDGKLRTYSRKAQSSKTL